MPRKREQDLRSGLHRSFNLILLGFALLGVAGIGSRLVGVRAVNELIHETQPLLENNARLLQVLTDAQSALRGYRLRRDDSYSDDFQHAVSTAVQTQAELRDLARDRPRVQRLLDVQDERVEAWLTLYRPLLRRIREDASHDPGSAVMADGAHLFDQIRVANERARTEIDSQSERLEADVRRSTIVAGIGLPLGLLIGLVVVGVVARRTTATVATPLEELRSTISRLSEGDLTARASTYGPTETQAVARAVNEMAESRERFDEMQKDAIRQLELLDEARSDFISSVSHELRTPLTSVTGYAEMLLDGDGGPLTEDQQRMVRTIDRNARRLLDLVEDILTVARMDVGTHRIAAEPVDIAAVAEAALEAVRPAMVAKSLSLDLDAPPQVGMVIGDRSQLERVLLNLLSNAVKFTPAGGRISVTAERQGKVVRLAVMDTGMGIPIAEQSRMFQRFFRSSTSRDEVIPGTGLGLSIVKALVEAHGGTIDFVSTPGRGTTFTVELPIAGREAITGQTDLDE